jgi:hypothetical protein
MDLASKRSQVSDLINVTIILIFSVRHVVQGYDLAHRSDPSVITPIRSPKLVIQLTVSVVQIKIAVKKLRHCVPKAPP